MLFASEVLRLRGTFTRTSVILQPRSRTNAARVGWVYADGFETFPATSKKVDVSNALVASRVTVPFETQAEAESATATRPNAVFNRDISSPILGFFSIAVAKIGADATQELCSFSAPMTHK